MLHTILFIVLCSSTLASVPQAKSENKSEINAIRFSVSESWPEPYAFFDGNRDLKSGILKDLMDELAKQMGGVAKYIHLSRNRIDAAVQKGSVDVRCFAHEDWTKTPEIYSWSKLFLTINNSVFWKKGKPAITKISDLENKTVGTVAGYTYTSINELFVTGKLKRSDVTTEQMNVALLQKDRIDYIIASTSAFKWMLKNEDGLELRTKTESIVVDTIPTKCAVLKSGKIKIKDIDRVLEKMLKANSIKKIESKYNLD